MADETQKPTTSHQRLSRRRVSDQSLGLIWDITIGGYHGGSYENSDHKRMAYDS